MFAWYEYHASETTYKWLYSHIFGSSLKSYSNLFFVLAYENVKIML